MERKKITARLDGANVTKVVLSAELGFCNAFSMYRLTFQPLYCEALMSTFDTLIWAHWVIPVEPGDVVLERYSTAIRNGDIQDVFPTEVGRPHQAAREVVCLDTHAVIPGFVNAHTYTPMWMFQAR